MLKRPLYIEKETLMHNLCLSESEFQEWIKEGLLPAPKIRDGKTVWQWSAVEKMMGDEESYHRIYFAEFGDFIKIGFTRDLDRRLWDLSLGLPGKLKPLFDMPGTIDGEKDIQRKFRHLRERGEWFRKAPDLIAYIETLRREHK